MGLPFLIAALVLNLNNTTWFKGEDGVETALWYVGGGLMALTVLWFAIVLIVGAIGVTKTRDRW